MAQIDRRLEIFVDGCTGLPVPVPLRCWGRSKHRRVSVRVQEIGPRRHPRNSHRIPMPATYVFGHGRLDEYGRVNFPSSTSHERFIEAHFGDGWRIRFEVRDDEYDVVMAFAEIEANDLGRKSVWKLLLSDPITQDAVYSNSKEFVRMPAFLDVRAEMQNSGGMPGGRSVDSSSSSLLTLQASLTAAHLSHASSILAASFESAVSPSPRKHVMIMTRGTRGDVQPFIALARGLIKYCNCKVTIVTELNWKTFAKDSREGLPQGCLSFRPSGGNTMLKIQSDTAQWALRIGQHFDTLQALMLSRSEVEFFPSEGCFFYWACVERPDFIVFGFTIIHIAMIISEKLEIPIVGFLLQPMREIEQRDPVSVVDEVLAPVREVVDGPAFNALLQQIMERLPGGFSGDLTLNDLRSSRGLRKLPRNLENSNVQFDELARHQVPMIVPINPLALGEQEQKLNDKFPNMRFTDFVFLRLGADELKSNVRDFIMNAKAERRKIIAVTFSSMPVGERRILRLALEICEHCNPPVEDESERRRPVVIAMVGGQDFDPPCSDVASSCARLEQNGRLLVLREGVPFGALFREIDAAVLHGGLGVTSEALFVGIPVVTSGILLMDQRYWAARVADLGCGSEGITISDAFSYSTDGKGPCLIVRLIQQSLDQRPGRDTWRKRAKSFQSLLTSSRRNSVDEDGTLINAREVFEAGISSAPICNAYSDGHCCCVCIYHQICCLISVFIGCFRWCSCFQLPACVRLVRRCAMSALCCRPCRRWCLHRLQTRRYKFSSSTTAGAYSFTDVELSTTRMMSSQSFTHTASSPSVC